MSEGLVCVTTRLPAELVSGVNELANNLRMTKEGIYEIVVRDGLGRLKGRAEKAAKELGVS